MQITFTLTATPTVEELALARRVLAVFGDASTEESEVFVPALVIAEQIHRAHHGHMAERIPSPPAPDTAFQSTVPPPVAPSVDSKGLSWDERIHSGNKTQNQDGSWKKRKGVEDATIAAVEAELRGEAAAKPPAPPMPPPPPSTPAVPAPPPVPGVTFQSAVGQKFADGLRTKAFPNDTLHKAAVACGVGNAVELAQRPELWSRAAAYLDVRALGVDHETAMATL